MTRAQQLLTDLCKVDLERRRCLLELVDLRSTFRYLRFRLAAEMRARGLVFLHVAGLPSAVLRSNGRIRLVRRRGAP